MAQTEQSTQLLKGPTGTFETLHIKFLLICATYFGLHILLRTLISPTLDYDEAEQALLSQWLLPGYTEQPPLYSWIQYLLFHLFGEGVLAISLLKNSLLFLTYLFVLLAGRLLFASRFLPILASAALLLIPQIGWESQRDMTHTTLVTCSAAATLWLLLRLLKNNSPLDYLYLGIGIGVGFMSKANYFAFLALLLPVFLSFQKGRKTLGSPRILITLLVAVSMAGPFFLWLLQHQDIALSASHKLHRPTENPLLHGLLSFFKNGLLFLTPFLIISFVSFRKTILARKIENNFAISFFSRYLFFFILLMCIAIFFFNITYVKDRWLQPILFVVPLFCFARLDGVVLDNNHLKTFFGFILLAAVTVYTVFTLRVVATDITGSFCRLNYPMQAIAAKIHKSGFKNGVIVSDNRFLAGNLRLQFPGSAALIPGYQFETHVTLHGTGLAVWKADQSAEMPEELTNYLLDNWAIKPNEFPVQVIEQKLLYSTKTSVKLATMVFPIPD